MTQQDKDLLLRDLCARLLDGVIIQHPDIFRPSIMVTEKLTGIDKGKINDDGLDVSFVKPYLRPLSSLTQEERDKFCDIGGVISYRPTDGKQYIVAFVPEALDYLNSIHADYRDMIEKGLAIEVTDENNPYK